MLVLGRGFEAAETVLLICRAANYPAASRLGFLSQGQGCGAPISPQARLGPLHAINHSPQGDSKLGERQVLGHQKFGPVQGRQSFLLLVAFHDHLQWGEDAGGGGRDQTSTKTQPRCSWASEPAWLGSLGLPSIWPQRAWGTALTGILLGYFIRISVTSCILVAVEEKRRSYKRRPSRGLRSAALPIIYRGFSFA